MCSVGDESLAVRSRPHDGTDPAWSVVDPDCRVHGVSNLYVTGASVFSTAGYANPTLTIVALATPLADHLLTIGPRRESTTFRPAECEPSQRLRS